VFFIFVWAFLYFKFRPNKNSAWLNIDRKVFHDQYKELGPVTFEQRIIFIDFILLAVLWLFRSDLTFGNFVIPGWSNIFDSPKFINDGTVAIGMALLLFLIPSKKGNREMIMDWASASRIPWNIVLLFGGGFALASGFKESGLSLWFGNQLNWVADMHPIIVIFTIAISMTFLTELTSNTATSEMLLPILAGLSVSTQINPLFFMLPATLSASMAFMLPVATPPNAIIFGTNRIRIMDMAKTGLLLNIGGAILITLATYYVGMYIFGIDISTLPVWVK